MDILTATIEDAEELTRVEIESKMQSIPEGIDAAEVDYERRFKLSDLSVFVVVNLSAERQSSFR